MIDLETALKAGDVEKVAEIVDQYPSLLEGVTSLGVSPILMASYYRQTQVAEALRDKKKLLDIFEATALGDRHEVDRLLALDPLSHRLTSPDGFNPLGYAAYFGHRELVRDLLLRGAEPNTPSQNDLRVTPLHSALSGGHKEMVRDLVEYDADVNMPSGANWTPLHYTAYAGDVETTHFLIEKGAQMDCHNSDGKLPATLASEQGHIALAELLSTAA